MYPEEQVTPMRVELTQIGFTELKTQVQVNDTLKKVNGTVLVFVNSVCGCSARNARPGVIQSLRNSKKPGLLATVFAGVDTEATAEARKYMLPYPPSSPSIALFKDGKLVRFIERHQIEGRSPAVIAGNLVEAYNEYC